MNKEQIMIDNSIVNIAQFYDKNHLPSQIGQAIYLYGNDTDYNVVGFVDASPELDGTMGMIFTATHIYFQFLKSGHFAYQDIVHLSLEKHHNLHAIATIQTNKQSYSFKNNFINQEVLLDVLSKVTGIEIEMILSLHEKVQYYISIILSDIENNEYEDIVLTNIIQKKIKDFYENLALIDKMDEENYQYELEVLCSQALLFFEELELDSEEIDELISIEQEFHHDQDNQFNQAKSYYDDLMNKYQQGDTQSINQIESMMNMLGIDKDELRGKSPKEIEQYLYDICDRFGVSRSLLEKMLKK